MYFNSYPNSYINIKTQIHQYEFVFFFVKKLFTFRRFKD